MGGGSDTQTVKSETKIPKWLEDAATENVARAQDISRIGYVPQYGPQVAAFAPQQEAAFANTNDMASAFGLQGGSGSYLPQAQTTAGGLRGYSTWDLAQENIERLKRERPAQYNAIMAQFIDPVNGGGGWQAGAASQPAQSHNPMYHSDLIEAMKNRTHYSPMSGKSFADFEKFPSVFDKMLQR